MVGIGNDSRFECERCGACCRWPGSVLLTDNDIETIAAVLGMAVQSFVDGHTRLAPNRKQLALLDNPDGSCVFLGGDDCRIYAARPLQCRTFPFDWAVRDGCPALDALKSG